MRPLGQVTIFARLTLMPVLVLGLLSVSSVWAQQRQAEAIPPATMQYKGRQIAATMHYSGAPWLLRDSRQREEDCDMMFEQLQLRPGMKVCDMGCGNGFYALRMAQAVAGQGGTVYAVDIQAEMLRLLTARAEEAGIDNIRPVLGTLVDPKLPEGQLDRVLLVDVYHEFSHPEQMLAAIRRSLKPDGVAVLVEFRGEDPEVPIKPLHKMTKSQILAEWPPNGFRLVRQYDGLPWQHAMFFGPDLSPASPTE